MLIKESRRGDISPAEFNVWPPILCYSRRTILYINFKMIAVIGNAKQTTVFDVMHTKVRKDTKEL